MKKIERPLDSGSTSFNCAARNKRLRRTYPNLLKLGLRAARLARYYDISRGDPNIIRAADLTQREKEAILYIYDNPPISMSYIGDLRLSFAGETCPMCGGQNPGELDHYLTKQKYPEYACLAYNLVPACSCNRLRGENLFDPATRARVLHPYYDECLSGPLIEVRFDPRATPPVFEIHYMIDEEDPDFRNVKFHVDNIILKTNFLTYVSKRWGKLRVQPDAILPNRRDYRGNKNQFQEYLVELGEGKSADEGANAWATIFLRSISNRIISDWIFDNC
ncbi:hypothetical protein [Chachezhania sediminis]|uniref:hypothetical protein n=1 Tax=Chachezhania sediminis TaxID=2599291 RepID=UPI00131D16ED|nr:hypothetical protein [Chachezhania sediminis]